MDCGDHRSGIWDVAVDIGACLRDRYRIPAGEDVALILVERRRIHELVEE